jgi:hypothetical protein
MGPHRGVFAVMDTMLITLAAGVIATLSTAVGILWKKNNELYEARITDLKDIGTRSDATSKEIIDMSKKIYKALPTNKKGK